MKRALLQTLLDWKSKPQRKPLLIDGARQTGKTYLLAQLFAPSFRHALRLDFLENPGLADIFSDSLDPEMLIQNIELVTQTAFNPETDLLLLDEIGECPRAIQSLKYFAEKSPSWFIAASGSNIGLLDSFPVGKVEQHVLRPLSFEEFLWATDQQTLINRYDQRDASLITHQALLDQLRDYYFTGGMPEAVSHWITSDRLSRRVDSVRQVQKDLIEGYCRDFGKYSGKTDAGLIESVFKQAPGQLSLVMRDSVKRFKFKGVHPKKTRYSDFESAITWLTRSRLVLPNFVVEGSPRSPLAAQAKPNRVKLFLFDVGLLNQMLGLSFDEIQNQSFEYKGFIAENYVQQEMAVQGLSPSYSWQDARAEIEFLITNSLGQIVPVEVKSGTRTRARSLQSYRDKCSPVKTIKLAGVQPSPATETTDIVQPLYYAADLIRLAD